MQGRLDTVGTNRGAQNHADPREVKLGVEVRVIPQWVCADDHSAGEDQLFRRLRCSFADGTAVGLEIRSGRIPALR